MTDPHPLAAMIDGALRGDPPAHDGLTEVVASPGAPGAAVIAFTGHFVVAGDVDAAEVASRCPRGELGAPMSPAFLLWLGESLRSRPVTHKVVFGAVAQGGGAPLDLVSLPVDHPHPRVSRSAGFRRDVRAYATRGEEGVLVLGRGLVGRWELAFEVEPSSRGGGLGRSLVASALALLPSGTPVYAQVATGNAASMRAVTAGGLRAVCAEVLFPTTGLGSH